MTTGLFIGRFQPFHSGHADAIEQIKEKCDRLIVCIGSSQYKGTQRNPLDVESRKVMVDTFLKKTYDGTFPYELFILEDLHNNDKWMAEVIETVPKFDVVYTGNVLVKELFRDAGYTVIDLRFNITISGEEIRDMIVHDVDLWKKFEPASVLEYLDSIHGVEQIHNVCAKD